VTVHAKGMSIVREGHGSGEGRGISPAEVHDIAVKAAETDATKRALATFGSCAMPGQARAYHIVSFRPVATAGITSRLMRNVSEHRLEQCDRPGQQDCQLTRHCEDA